MRWPGFSCLLVLVAAAQLTSAQGGADYLYDNLATFVDENKAQLLQTETTDTPVQMRINFPCQLIHVSPEVPTSVHKLRPSDIKVVAAIGDSITAAFGADATNVLNLFTEYRGVSWSGGGQDTYYEKVTMPNILKLFNSKLLGYAVGNGGPKSSNAVFNIAVSGAVAADLPGQARTLLEKFTTSPDVNLTEDWKLVTVWIGGNDLCAACNDEEYYSSANYGLHLQETLDTLSRIPRLFVNLVAILDVTRLHELQEGSCDSFHKTVCPCVQRSDETRALVSRLTQEYQAVTQTLATNPRYLTESFAVNFQPFFINTQIPRTSEGLPDRSYFAPDCFHFAGKAQAAAAVGLWNNMLQADGTKAQTWELGQEPKCPTAQQPYLCTPINNCGAVSGMSAHDNTGGVAPPATMNVEQRTMFGLALVLIVAVPLALLAYLVRRRRLATAARVGYAPLPGDTLNLNAPPAITAV